VHIGRVTRTAAEPPGGQQAAEGGVGVSSRAGGVAGRERTSRGVPDGQCPDHAAYHMSGGAGAGAGLADKRVQVTSQGPGSCSTRRVGGNGRAVTVWAEYMVY
jgi:hypothetical protein